MSQFEQLPEAVQRQLRALSQQDGLPGEPDLLERLARNWVSKRKLVDEQIEALRMVPLEHLDSDDPRGFIGVTRSGSLVVLGPLSEGADGRWLEYASIELREDVPDIVRTDGVSLTGPARVGDPLTLSSSPVERTSELMRIAGFEPDLSAADQDRRLREAATFLTNGFLKLNQAVMAHGQAPDHFTTRSMIAYVAAKNGIPQALAKQIVDDFLTTAETGMALGERVPLGRLGRLTVAPRPPRKARLARNPRTGEEVLVPAKPERAVPRMSFSKRLRERISAVHPESIKGK